jgi:hypothetical protein
MPVDENGEYQCSIEGCTGGLPYSQKAEEAVRENFPYCIHHEAGLYGAPKYGHEWTMCRYEDENGERTCETPCPMTPLGRDARCAAHGGSNYQARTKEDPR